MDGIVMNRKSKRDLSTLVEMTGKGIDFVIIYAKINRKCLLLQAKQRRICNL